MLRGASLRRGPVRGNMVNDQGTRGGEARVQVRARIMRQRKGWGAGGQPTMP